jgi:uncharacterized protein (TIGR02266 family)
VDLEVPIEIRNRDNQITGITQNISAGGVFVATRRVLPAGNRVTLTFRLPDDERVEVDAEVRWLRAQRPIADDGRPPGMGLRFVATPIGAAASIQEFVRSREPVGD